MEKLPKPVYISHEMVTNTRQFYIVLYTCKFKRSSMVETFLKAFFFLTFICINLDAILYFFCMKLFCYIIGSSYFHNKIILYIWLRGLGIFI